MPWRRELPSWRRELPPWRRELPPCRLHWFRQIYNWIVHLHYPARWPPGNPKISVWVTWWSTNKQASYAYHIHYCMSIGVKTTLVVNSLPIWIDVSKYSLNKLSPWFSSISFSVTYIPSINTDCRQSKIQQYAFVCRCELLNQTRFILISFVTKQEKQSALIWHAFDL